MSTKKPARVFPNQQLKQARVRQGWSQEYVAQEIGTDAFTVSRWERGVTVPSPHFRPKICALFGMSAVELGLVPQNAEELLASNPAAQELFPAVKASVLDPAIPPLPEGEPGLVGRDELVRRLKQQLLAGKQVALCALNGLPGVGKTALATVLAHDRAIQEHFSAGILWAGLGRQPDVLGVLSRWGTLLGSMPADLAQRSSPVAWAASLHAAIGQRPMLLVLDDAWEIADALALRIGGPRCAHLVTTRFPEIARRFAADGTTLVRELGNTDGRLLLMRLAPDAVQTEPQEAQALVAAVGGLPLALTLLGHFLRVQAHSGQPRRIRAALERLRNANERLHLAEPQTLIGNHPSLEAGTPLSLQAVIGLSDQQLSAPASAALRALAAFPPKPNTFSEEAAIEISALPVETLDELTDAGLLESSGPTRYTLHQTIADYASADARDPAALDRLVRYFVAFVVQHRTDYPTLDLESSNILAALDAAYAQEMQTDVIQGVHAFALFLITRGLYAVAETLLQRSLAAARELDDRSAQVAALIHLGRIEEQRSHYLQAQMCWQDALALARQQGDARASARVLLELGSLARFQGQPRRARQLLTEALASLDQPEDQQVRASTLRNLANLASDQGEAELGRELYGEALTISRRLGDRRGMALTLASLGVLAREQSLPEQAREFYEESLSIFREIGDYNSASSVLMNLGNLARHQGHTEQASQLYKEALSLSRQVENRRVSTFILLNIAGLASDQGQFEYARQTINQIIPIFREFQDLRNVALAFQALGDTEREERLFAPAREHLEEALRLFRELHEQRQIGLTMRSLGALARLDGRLGDAHTMLNEALLLLEQVSDQREATQVRQELGSLALQEDRLDDAQTLFMGALDAMRRMRDRRYAAHTLSELGRLALRRGEMAEALRALLGAGVGMRLIHSFEAAAVEEMLQELRTQLGETEFLAIANRLARSTPELAYGLSQASWRAAIQNLLATAKDAG